MAAVPRFLKPDCVPAADSDKEMEFVKSQTENSGKAAGIVEKIVAGRMNKYHEEVELGRYHSPQCLKP